MRILLTGGGSGGHFYPVIAVAGELRRIAKEKKLLDPALYFMSDTPYDTRLLFENEIMFIRTPAGKLRRYASIKNIFDPIKTFFGVLRSVAAIFRIFPDVVFGKGGYASFPALLAARLFRIPVVIHESDSVPGRVNAWAGKFARGIAISYPEAAAYFPQEKVALTGNPIRRSILAKQADGAFDFLKLRRELPVLLVLGGSQGAQILNDTLLDALPQLIGGWQVIHQTGKEHIEEITGRASVILGQTGHRERYLPFGYLNDQALSMAAGAATIALSRAGSTIFEIAAWGIPSIIVPISDSQGDHQRENAYNYARNGAAVVIEEENFSPNILASQASHLLSNANLRETMAAKARGFARLDAAEKIANELLAIALEHEE